jgi:hypothetical protein
MSAALHRGVNGRYANWPAIVIAACVRAALQQGPVARTVDCASDRNRRGAVERGPSLRLVAGPGAGGDADVAAFTSAALHQGQQILYGYSQGDLQSRRS